MTVKQRLENRITSLLLCFAIILTITSFSTLTASAASSNINRVADASTMDDWKQFFSTDNLTTENAGGVWTDKSVFTDASAFAGTGITADNEDSFLVALSAIASNMSITGMSNVPTDSILCLMSADQ